MTFAVGVAGVALAIGVGLIAQVSVKQQERRLLTQKAVDADAFLTTLFTNAQDSLRVLTGDGVPTGEELSGYIARPGPFGGSALAVVSARPGPDGLVTAAAIGRAPSVGEAIRGERARVLARAISTGKLATAVLHEKERATLLVAFPSHDAVGVYATAQESVLYPTIPLPRTEGSPFADVRGAFYIGLPHDANLILTTERDLPLHGTIVRVSVPIGADNYTTTIAARTALIGGLERAVPAVLLAGGLLMALMTATVAHVLWGRREDALALVDERTEQLTEAHDFLEGIFASGPLVVARRDVTAGVVTYMSPNIERIFGYTVEAASKNGFLSHLLHSDDLPVFTAALDAVACGNAPQAQVEARLRIADGSYRWISLVLVGERNDDHVVGAPHSFVAEYVLDVDDRRRAEIAQQDAQRAAEAAQTVAEQASRHKSDFLSHMSHELRTPLNAVLGFAQLLALEISDDSQQEEIRQILEGGNHLLALINELLDIARIESGHLTVSLEDVDPTKLVDDAIDLIRPLAQQRQINISRELEACEGWCLRADAQRAKQVLLNLLSNATKYNRPAGSITVNARVAKAGRIAIEVTDTGPGVAPEKLERLFEPFERVGAEYTGVDGAGIGLAVARQLSTAMGATLEVASTVGVGSTFTVEFEAVPAQNAAAARALTGIANAAPRDLLYIEDDVANLKLVERLMTKVGQFRLIGALTATLGLQLAREHEPALILLDLNLPDMSGEEVLRQLRADPSTASIPIVVLSADAVPSRVQRLLDAGAAAYLTKPLVLTEVLRVIHEAALPVTVTPRLAG